MAEQVVSEYLAPLKEAGVDTVMLGCTHYPLLRSIIANQMGEGVELVDVGAQCARWVAGQLTAREMRTDSAEQGLHRYYVSDTTRDFAALASAFLGEDVAGGVEQIDITVY